MLLDVVTQRLALHRHVLLAQQVLDDADAQCVDIGLVEVQPFQQEWEVFDLWGQVVPAAGVLSLLLEVVFEDWGGAVGVDQFELFLALYDVAGFDIEVWQLVVLVEPFEGWSGISEQIPNLEFPQFVPG